MKVKKSLLNKLLLKLFNKYFGDIAENINRQSKNNLINYDDDNIDSQTHFMEQAFNKPYPSMEYKCTTAKEIEQIIKFIKKKKLVRVQRDIHKDCKSKLPFHKFSNILHM